MIDIFKHRITWAMNFTRHTPPAHFLLSTSSRKNVKNVTLIEVSDE